LTTEPQPAPRPAGWQQEHRRRYEETNGEEGHLWNGVPTLLLSTLGRRSHEVHTTPLIYGRDGDSYLVVASVGGGPKHPNWYLNLVQQPIVRVQVVGEKFTARTRPATPEEKPDLWRTMAAIWPAYDDYQKRTERDIPVVIIEKV
jgi:deazaflavin-dependent oxidoreductase (nitroreductase family)